MSTIVFSFFAGEVWFCQQEIDKTNLLSSLSVMKTLNLNKAKARFSSIVEQVEQGATVIICKRNLPVARMISGVLVLTTKP